jgi:hypothetical protein
VTSLRVRKAHRHSTEMEMVLQEGKNRELRRILAAVGHKVMKLRRVQLGPLKLGELPVGAHRPLSADELDKLRHYAYSSRAKKQSAKAGGKGPLAAAGAKLSRERQPPEPVEDDEVEYTGPVLVDDELTQFDDRSFASSSPGERRAGAIIGDEEDQSPAQSAPPRPKGMRPGKKLARPGKFAKGRRGGAASRPPAGKKTPQKFPRKKR